ncbi:MAG: LbtU family siderophore porin [Desulfobulbus sp.]|jgi:hypothetical protein
MIKKTLSRTTLAALFGALCTTLCLGAGNAFAASVSEAELRDLKTQIEDLQQRNGALTRRLASMEEALAGQSARIQDQEKKIDEKVDGNVFGRIGKYVSVSGLLEGDLVFSGDYAGSDTSEITLSAVEFGFDVALAEWANAHTLLKYEGEDDDFFLDEGYLTLGKTEALPAFLTVGKMVTPFGDYSTNMLQDPFTQTLGEINEGSIVLGYARNGVTASTFAYNGVDELGDNKEINGFGLGLRYDLEQEGGLNLNVGVGWVNNLASSGGIRDVLPRTEDDEPQLTDAVAGLNLHAGASYGAFSAQAEYTAALDSFDAADLPFRDSGAQPAALNGELAYSTAIQGIDTVFALGVQKTWESLGLELPELRYSAAIAVTILEGATVTLEYFLDEDYDFSDGGTGDDGYGFTTRLAYEF